LRKINSGAMYGWEGIATMEKQNPETC